MIHRTRRTRLRSVTLGAGAVNLDLLPTDDVVFVTGTATSAIAWVRMNFPGQRVTVRFLDGNCTLAVTGSWGATYGVLPAQGNSGMTAAAIPMVAGDVIDLVATSDSMGSGYYYALQFDGNIGMGRLHRITPAAVTGWPGSTVVAWTTVTAPAAVRTGAVAVPVFAFQWITAATVMGTHLRPVGAAWTRNYAWVVAEGGGVNSYGSSEVLCPLDTNKQFQVQQSASVTFGGQDVTVTCYYV